MNPGRRIVMRTPPSTSYGPKAARWPRHGAARSVWTSFPPCCARAQRVLSSPSSAPDEFPGGYCYLASEWGLPSGDTVVLLEIAR
ncbi:MAG: hypothetical protein JSU82_14285 [Rhodospirillales bacterium]|nr:MAG: hypothetical protein JSU82_14285 [Rhodospirillales bacterium]